LFVAGACLPYPSSVAEEQHWSKAAPRRAFTGTSLVFVCVCSGRTVFPLGKPPGNAPA